MAKQTRQDWRVTFENRIGSFVSATWRAMMRDAACRRVYFYYSRTNGRDWGEFFAVPDGDAQPSGAELVTAEPIPAGTVEQIGAFVRRFTGQLPIIPEGI